MNAPTKFKVLDLFSGIGGFSLGLERTGGFETVAFCEIELFPRKVLKKHWPGVPCHSDIRVPPAEWCASIGRNIDVVTGGYPCQPFSTASRGRRTAIDLWPKMLGVVRHVRPSYVIAENVQEATIARSASELRDDGYSVYCRRIAAADAGADHQRDRWWAIAYTDHESQLPRIIDAEVAKLPEICRSLWGPANYSRAVRVSDGLSNRVHRLGTLGSAVVPQVVTAIGHAILAASAAS